MDKSQAIKTISDLMSRHNICPADFIVEYNKIKNEETKKREFPSGAYTLVKDEKTGEIKKMDFLEKLMSL